MDWMQEYVGHFIDGKTPRWYQEKGVKEVHDLLGEGWRRLLLKMPTGCGKTLTARMLTQHRGIRQKLIGDEQRPLRVLWITHMNELSRQAQEAFSDLAEHVELIPQSAFSDVPEAVLERGWDMAIMDEAHHEEMMSIQILLDRLIRAPIIGLTADERRGDGLMVKFEKIVHPITEAEAIRGGYIARPAINTFIETSGSDKTWVTQEILRWNAHAMGSTLVFLRTESEALRVAEYINEVLGYRAETITKDVGNREMSQMLQRLSHGETDFVVNCQRVGEGVDIAGLTDVVLGRTFQSLAEKRQYIGRSIRLDEASQQSEVPSQVWEVHDPLGKYVTAQDVIPVTRFERMFIHRKGSWEERLLSGTLPDGAHTQDNAAQPRVKPKSAPHAEQVAPLDSGMAVADGSATTHGSGDASASAHAEDDEPAQFSIFDLPGLAAS